MAPPSKGQVKIVTEALHVESAKWARLADDLSGVKSVIENNLDLMEGAFFVAHFNSSFLLSQTYAKLQNTIARLVGEGSIEFDEMSGALIRAEERYSRTDSQAAQDLHSIYRD
jgi:hypothetical protein